MNLHRDLSRESERGREEKSKSRDLTNRSLKTNREREKAENLHRDLFKEGKRAKAQI